MFLLRNTVYLKEGHNTSHQTSNQWQLQWLDFGEEAMAKHWKLLFEDSSIVVSFSLVPPQEVQSSIRVCQAQGERAQPCCCISLARPGCIIVPCYWLCWSAGLLPACCSACQLFVYLAITPCKPWSFLNTRRVRGFIYEESELMNFEC